jgi:hypothetical protein
MHRYFGVAAAMLLAGCAASKSPAARPSWSAQAYADQRSDPSWHLAYAVQGWAAEHTGHVVVVPVAHNIVVPESFFGQETSHFPTSAVPAGTGQTKEGITTLSHGWTTHHSSWDFDTDIKFVMFGPGIVRQNLRLGRTTLQNLAPTYARLIGTDPPRGSSGRVMTEALVDAPRRPKVILTVVIDAGGRELFRTWSGSWPTIASLAARGAEYSDAKVTNLETATGPSHAAVGTGAYPLATRIVSNEIFDPTRRKVIPAFGASSPRLLAAPTLADSYGTASGHRAVVISSSLSSTATLGMVGHGASADPGNGNQIAIFFGVPPPEWEARFPGPKGAERLMTNPDLFRFPEYLQGRSAEASIRELEAADGTWLGHKLDPAKDLVFTPAGVRFDCENMLLMLEREPIDRGDATALVYMNLKGADYSSHRWGRESLETRDNLAAEDACIGRLVQKLNERVGEGNYVVTITADHGIAPLPELVGGHRLLLEKLLALIDTKFGAKISVGGSSMSLWFDQGLMKERGLTNAQIAEYLRALTAGDYYGPQASWPKYLPYRPDERLFFDVFTTEQIGALAGANGAAPRNPYVTGDGGN